jgi:hypothetical protein
MFDLVGPYFKVLKERFGNILNTLTGCFGIQKYVCNCKKDEEVEHQGPVQSTGRREKETGRQEQRSGERSRSRIPEFGDIELQDLGGGDVCVVDDLRSEETVILN